MLVAATQAKQDSSLPLPTATTNNELSSIASLKHRPTFVDDEVVMPVPTTAAELLCIRASALLARKIRGLEDMDEYEEPRRVSEVQLCVWHFDDATYTYYYSEYIFCPSRAF